MLISNSLVVYENSDDARKSIEILSEKDLMGRAVFIREVCVLSNNIAGY